MYGGKFKGRLALGAVVVLVLSFAGRANASTSVITIAGSGRVGFADGRANDSTFVYPTGVARSRDGTIYISDAGAQRIRALRDGIARTIAGGGSLNERGLWVPGGYLDGPGSIARFNGPSGVAVDARGRVFVSDTNNRCIRMIDTGGNVSTYAGSLQDPRTFSDGPRMQARFNEPLQLALAKDGTLFVADFGNGIRKISPDGNVSTVYTSRTTMGVAVDPNSANHIFVAEGSALTAIRDGNVYTFVNDEHRARTTQGALRPAMDRDLGHPYMITAIDASRVFFTDAWTGAIKYLDTKTGTLRVLIGTPANNGAHDGSGFGDGPLTRAKVADAAGLTTDNIGNIIVADAYNRRIRQISGVNLHDAIVPGFQTLSFQRPPASLTSIAVIGNSFVWHDTMWDDSCEGQLERDLKTYGINAYIQPIVLPAATLPAIVSYLDQVVRIAHQYQVVVLVVNNDLMRTTGLNWQEVTRSGVTQIAKRLADDGIRLIVAYHPLPGDLIWGELPTYSFPRNVEFASARPAAPIGRSSVGRGGPGDFQAVPTDVEYARVVAMLRTLRITFVDLWPDFISEEKRADHVSLFGTTDQHFSAEGRAFMGHVLAAALRKHIK